MKTGLEIKKLRRIPAIFWLVSLLLLSPCKVRNFIQDQFEIPLTNVLNKSQSVKQAADCLSFEVSKALQTKLKQNVLQSNFTLPNVCGIERVVLPQEPALTPYTSRPPLALDVPLYILYQNILVYS